MAIAQHHHKLLGPEDKDHTLIMFNEKINWFIMYVLICSIFNISTADVLTFVFLATT